MAYDKAIALTGPANAGSGDAHYETVTASATKTGVKIGKNRLVVVEQRVAGAVTGTSPTLFAVFEESDTLGGTYTEIGSKASTGSNTGARTPQRTSSDESGGGAVPGTGPDRIAFLTSKPYVRARLVAGGTTPSFGEYSLLAVPVRAGAVTRP